MSKYSVFISYRRTGFETANLIAEKLRSYGYSVFFDVESLRDGKFNEQLFNVIDKCTDFVLILSENALDRCVDKDDWVRKEVTYAMLKGKNIVPVMLSGFTWPNPMPVGMESLKEYPDIKIPQYEYFDYAYECIIRHLNSENKMNYTTGLHEKNQTEEVVNYHVFISCKSEDYDFAQPIHDFLIANGLKVFFADAELKEKAESQYADVIDEALDVTKHLIVVATSIEYIKSKWVKYEWSTFSNDLKSNYRDGNLITVLSPDITPRMLPASLRHMQSFPIEDYKEVLPYVKK